jgi:hypothetical protein
MSRAALIRYHAIASLLAVPVLGVAVWDLMSCAKQNAALSGAADAGARAGIYELAQGAGDAAVLAAARRAALAQLEDRTGVDIAARMGENRKSVIVSMHRPGILCWSQVVGLAENRSALAAAHVPDPDAPRPKSNGCPIASFIPC